MNTQNKKVKLIFDNNNTIYIGVILSETAENYLIHNPAQVFYNIDEETKNVEIKMIPLCFPEILSKESKTNGTTWVYKKTNAKFVSYDDVTIESNVTEYYDNLFSLYKNAK